MSTPWAKLSTRTSALALVAGALVLALGAVIALGSTLAHADSAGGGLSVTPALIEHPAVVAGSDSIALANTTKGALRITVTARPWVQASNGAVTPDRHKTIGPPLLLSLRSFTLAPGASQSVTLTLLAPPPNGSLFGSIEAIGVPVGASKHKGVSVGYRLISSLRLDPAESARKFKLTAGTPRVQGGKVVLPVRNAGNTIEPVTGSGKITSSLGARPVTIAAQRIVPGATVLLPLTAAKGLAKGHYSVTYTLSQSGHTVAKATVKFVI